MSFKAICFTHRRFEVLLHWVWIPLPTSSAPELPVRQETRQMSFDLNRAKVRQRLQEALQQRHRMRQKPQMLQNTLRQHLPRSGKLQGGGGENE